MLQPLLDERGRQREQRAAEERSRQQELQRLDGIERRIGELGESELAEVEHDPDRAFSAMSRGAPRSGG